MPGSRLSQALTSFTPLMPQSAPQPGSLWDLLENLTHFSIPTLSHLLTLLSNPTQNHTTAKTTLIIIESLSTLITNAFPRSVDTRAAPRKPGGEHRPNHHPPRTTLVIEPISAANPSTRKFPILQYLINALQKLAATRTIAVVITAQCITKMRPGAGAVLVPAINTNAWEQGLGSRVALSRDWGWDDKEGNPIHGVRLAQVIKAEGLVVPEDRSRLVAFTVVVVCALFISISMIPIYSSLVTYHSPVSSYSPSPQKETYSPRPKFPLNSRLCTPI